MPTIASSKQPTIAIITAQYCEKLAVDSMIENKETFVRYTTVGKSLYFQYFIMIYFQEYTIQRAFKIIILWLFQTIIRHM